MSEIKSRDEIDNKYKWDIKKIFKNEKEFESLYQETEKSIKEFSKYQNHVMKNAKTFLEVIKKDIEISRRLEKLYCYSSLKSDEDVSNNKNQERVGKVLNLYDLASKNMYFVTPEVLKEDYSKIEEFYKQEKELLEYEKMIKDMVRYKKYTLSDTEEKLLSNLGKAFGQDETTYGYLTDSDLKFGMIKDENGKEQELTDTNYSLFIRSKKRTVRKEVFERLYNTYEQFKNSISSLLDGHIKENVTLSHIRKYKTAFAKSLYKDELDEKVYQSLVDTVHNNLDVYQKLLF